MMIPVRMPKNWAQERGSTFVHPFDDLDIVAGQGSIAMEIVRSFRPSIIFLRQLAAAD